MHSIELIQPSVESRHPLSPVEIVGNGALWLLGL
jgi:hypothetical protein